MAKKQGNTVLSVKKIVEPIITNLGFQLWDVRFVKEGAEWYLRIFIDHEDGISIEDCEKVSRAIDAPLDENDPIEQSYFLEVCSPGVERELILPEHYQRFIGSNIKVRMIRASENIGKELFGVLEWSDETAFIISDSEGKKLTVNKKDTAWVKLDDF